mgnify:CR=1 FL=1
MPEGAFKNRIRQLREEHYMTQEELANKLDVNKQTISQYERGVRNPDFEKLENLCDIFNVSSDYLLGRDSVTVRLLDDDEMHLLTVYRRLSPEGREMLRTRLRELELLGYAN